MSDVLTRLPPDDAPIDEWCRPLSATCNTRPNAVWYSRLPSDDAPRQTGIKPPTRKPRVQITPAIEARIGELARRDQTYREIATDTGVSESEVARIAVALGYGRGQGRGGSTRRCAVPGCGRVLHKDNKSGVCRDHPCAAGYCQCRVCKRGPG